MTEIKDRIKELRRIRAGDLKPHPKNYRTHPPEQVAALKGAVTEIGWADVAVVYETRDGIMLIDGHARAELDPDAMVPCVVLDVDDAEAEKVLATLDPLTEMAKVDQEKLNELLAGLKFDDDALNSVIADLAKIEPLTGASDVDDVPEPPDEPTTQLGDVWVMGDHRLMCGNSAAPEELDVLLGGKTIHLVNTDPPYNVKVEPRSNNAIAAGNSSFTNKHHQKFDLERPPEKAKGSTKKMRAKDRPLANDFVTDEEFDRLLAGWFGNIARVLQPGRSFYIWGGYANCANYPPVLKACELYFSQAIIWVKEHPVLTRKDFMGNHEWCFYGWRLGAGHKWFGPTNATDVWNVKKVNPQSMVHLTEKPVELAVRAIEYSSKRGENVLDLFGGSGSTMMGCEQTGRRAFSMELDPAYCDVIVERWEKFTGKKAELIRADH